MNPAATTPRAVKHLPRCALAPLLGAAALLLAGCSRSAPPASTSEENALPVQTGLAELRTITRHVEVPGTVRPVERAVLAPRVMGVVEELTVGLGSNVRRGDLLVRIGARDIAARVAQAEAQLAQIEGDLRRETQLLASGASTSEMVRTLETQQRSARAALDEARTLLSYTSILAPFDGTITRRPVNEGDLASPGVPLLEIEGRDRLRVEAELPESLAQLRPGLALEVRVGREATVAGTLAEISPSADTNSRTALAKVDLPPSSPGVRSGQFVRVAIPGDEERVVVMPASALSLLGQLERVFTVEDGRARLRLVRTGATTGESIEVLAGLDGGETLVLNPPAALRDGVPVAVQP